MKKYTLPFLAFLLLACATSFTNCNAGKKAQTQVIKDPYMTFDNPTYDFGTVKVGGKASHIYTFTNTFDKDITIELISGCHCTDLEYYEGKTYKPGEIGTIKATFDSNKEEERGELNKTIDILLENEDPTTGYQIIKEIRYKVKVVE